MKDFNSIEQLQQFGFQGFKSIAHYRVSYNEIPDLPGVYVVISEHKSPGFLEVGSGGYFKGKNPNVDLKTLEYNWIDTSKVIYIGQAGGGSSSSTLRKRLKQYLAFGNGKAVGHYGGRLIWQLKNHEALLLGFCPLMKEDARIGRKT